MNNALILRKIGMTQIINESGKVVNVTVLQNIPSHIVEIKSQLIHNYTALVIGYNAVNDKFLTSSRKGYFAKHKVDNFKNVKELRFSSSVKLDLEDTKSNNSLIDFSSFEIDDVVSFKGKSKGKGFQGTIKAHGFHRGPMSHGSKNHRLPGSIGAGTDPARVFKGTKMGKRCGNKNVTTKNLSIVKIDNDNQLIFVKGCVPGNPDQSLVMYK